MRLPQGSAISGVTTEAVFEEPTAPGPQITLISPNLLRQEDVVKAEAKVKGSPKERVKELAGALAKVRTIRVKVKARARKESPKTETPRNQPMPAPIRILLRRQRQPDKRDSNRAANHRAV